MQTAWTPIPQKEVTGNDSFDEASDDDDGTNADMGSVDSLTDHGMADR